MNRPTPGRILAERLSEATALDPAMAEDVVTTAVRYIQARRPDLAPRLERLLGSRLWSIHAARMIGRVAASIAPVLLEPGPDDPEQ